MCVCVVHERIQTRAHTLGPSEGLSGRIVLSTECARGKILAVTPHAHWGTVMGATRRAGVGKCWVFGCKFNRWGSLITQLQFEPHANTHMNRQNLKRPSTKKAKRWLQNVLKGRNF